MKVLVWNVQRVGNPSFHFTFQRLGQLYHPELCILLETRLGDSSLERVCHCFPGNWGFYAIESQGLSGGIIVVWDHGIARVDIFHHCSQHVEIVVTKSNGLTWLLSGVYASMDYKERRIL